MAEMNAHVAGEHMARITAILSARLPAVERAWVFGSRATGRGLKPHSDLDLLIDAPSWTVRQAADIVEAFSESDLPYRVDVLRLQDADHAFAHRLLSEGAVEIHLSKVEHA